MRWTKVILAAALALGAAPATAGNGTRTQGMTAERRAAWLAERARLAEGLPFVADYAPGDAPSDAWDTAYLADAGDLDGDGAGDVVDIRSRMTYDDNLGEREAMRLDAYRGRDGKALWTVNVPSASYIFPVPTKVGVDGKPGILVVAYDSVAQWEDEGGGGVYRTTVYSYDRTGKPLWATELDGVDAYGSPLPIAYAGSGSWGDVDGFFDAVAGGGTDLLVKTVTYGETYNGLAGVYLGRAGTQFGVLDGATGGLRPLGTPVVGEWGSARGLAQGDLDKDKLDDAVIEVETDRGVTLTAYSTAVGGGVLWDLADPGDGWREYHALPDVSGDGVADLTIQTESYGVIAPVPSGTAGVASHASDSIKLVDGARGKVLWRKTGHQVFAIGNADRKGGSEVVVGSYIYGKSSGFTAAAYTGSGKKVWSVTRTMKGGAAYASFGPVGDVGTDGVIEVGYGVRSGSGKKMRRDEGTIDGRTGRVTRDPRPGLFATRAALDGRGADAYEVATSGGVVTLSAWSGSSPSRLWSVGVKAAGFHYSTVTASIDGDKCGDLAVALWAGNGAYTNVVYSGSAGTPLWVLSRTGDAAAKVAKPTVKKHKVYRRGC